MKVSAPKIPPSYASRLKMLARVYLRVQYCVPCFKVTKK